MNVVMTGAGHFVEVQGTAEGAAFSRRRWTRCWLWRKGIGGIDLQRHLVRLQRGSLSK
jgi:ribonuclease PH